MRYKLIAGQLRHVNGWQASPKDHRDFLMAPPPSPIPVSASLRSVCPPIRNQGRRGTCTANASLEAMGFLYTKDGKVDPQLSRLFTYFFSRRLMGVPPTEDSGCQIRLVMQCLASMGSPLEASWPYSDDDTTFTHEPSPQAVAEALHHLLLFYYRCPSLLTVKASIAQGFPVVGGFACPKNMFTDTCAQTGVIQYPGPTEGFEGGHAVLFIGYDDATQLLCFQNSWSEDWGDKGFGYLPYRFVEDGLADDFWSLRREEMP